MSPTDRPPSSGPGGEGIPEDETRSLSAGPVQHKPEGIGAISRRIGEIKSGDRLGNYELLEPLGRGAMGAVYKARHTSSNHVVAIKVLMPAVAALPKVVERFRREAKIAARVAHPNVVAAIDADEAAGMPFLVMEFVEGNNLAKYTRERDGLPVAVALAAIIDAARGLAHAHELGVIHRDVKPSNLIRDAAGMVRVLDLGLARSEGLEQSLGATTGGVTSSGATLGTLDFMAPEQARDSKRVDCRADVYGLGCTLFFLLTCRVMYPAESLLAKINSHARSPIPPLGNEFPAGLEWVYAKMVAKRPEERYADMIGVIADLELVLAGQSPTIASDAGLTASWVRHQSLPNASDSTRPSRKSLHALAGVLALIAVAIGLAVYYNVGSEAPGDGQNDQPPVGPNDGQHANVGVTPEDPFAGLPRLLNPPPPVRPQTPPGFPALIEADTKPEQMKKLQAEWADKLKRHAKSIGPLEIEFALVPPGSIPRRAVPGKPTARAWITQPYMVGVTEVTHEQFRRFVEATGYVTVAERSGDGGKYWNTANQEVRGPTITWRKPHAGEPTADEPVTQICWHDAVAFCGWLSAQEKAIYRLPTEAEWELAAMAWMNQNLLAEGWLGEWLEKSEKERTIRPHPVGKTGANAFGLRDLFGNVEEWCHDGAGNGSDSGPYIADPQGSITSILRIVRGGSWQDPARGVGATQRRAHHGNLPQANIGFRIVRELPRLPELTPIPRELPPQGRPIAPLALVQSPPLLPSVRSWSVELLGHYGEIARVACSPEGKWVATLGQRDGAVRVWDRTGQLLRVFFGGVHRPSGLIWSPSGQFVASSAIDGVFVWEFASGKLVARVASGEHEGGMAWSPDGSRLAVNGGIVDIHSGLFTSLAGNATMKAVGWSPDGNQLATTGSGNPTLLSLWNTQTLEPMGQSAKPELVYASALVWSRDGKAVVSVCQSGIRVWDVRERAIKTSMPDKRPNLVAGAWDEKGHLVTAGNSVLTVWDIEAQKPVVTGPVSAGHYSSSPDGKVLAVVSDRLEFYDAATAKRMGVPAPLPGGSAGTSAFLTGDGKQVMTLNSEQQSIWDAQSGNLLRKVDGALPGTLRASPDGKWLVSFSGDGKSPLAIFDVADSKQRMTLEGHRQGVAAVAWSHDGSRLATVGRENVVRLWDPTNGKSLLEFKGHAKPITDVAWSPDNKRLATCCPDENVVLIWLAATGEVLDRADNFPDNQPIDRAAWGLDDTRMVLSQGVHVLVYDLVRKRYEPRFSPYIGTNQAVSRSPGGRFVAVPDSDHFVKLVSLAERGYEVVGAFGNVTSWHADGRRFLAASPNGAPLRGYDAASRRLLGALFPALSRGQTLVVGANGHYRGPRLIDGAIAFVALLEDGTQTIYRPAEFQKKFGWVNDPDKAEFFDLPALPATSPAGAKPVPPPVLQPIEIATDPLNLKPGEPAAFRALVAEPAKLAGLRGWSVETAGFGGGVDALALSPDGKWLAGGGRDTVIRIFPVGDDPSKPLSDRPSRMLLGHGDSVHALSWAPDGRLLASLGEDRTLRVWDVPSGRRLKTITLGSSGRAVAWSPTGVEIAVVAANKITIFDLRAGTQKDLPPPHDLNDLAWSPDGKLIVAAYNSGLRVWDPAKPMAVRELDTGGLRGPFSSLAWSRDGKRIAARFAGPERDNRLGVWTAADGKLDFVQAVSAHPGSTPRVAFSFDSETVVTSGALHAFELKTGQRLDACTQYAESIAFTPDGRWLLGLSGGRLSALDPQAGAIRQAIEITAWTSDWAGIAISEDGKSLLTSSHNDREARIWDAGTGRLLKTLRGMPGSARYFLSPAGDWLLVAFDALSDNLILIGTNDAKPRILSGHSHGIYAAVWSADGRTLVTGGKDNTLIVWDVVGGTLRKRLKGHTGVVHCLARSPDGTRIASGAQDRTIRIWDLQAGTEIDRFDGDLSHHLQALMWLPDGKSLQVKWPDGSLAKLDFASRKATPIRVQGLRSDSSTWSRDGKLAAGVGPEGLYIDYGAGQKPFAIPGGRGDDVVTWLPDNRRLMIAAPQELTVRGFDAQTRRRLGTALPFVDGGFATIGHDGHVAGPNGTDERLLFVAIKDDGSQLVLTRSEFEKAFGWQNDPLKARLLEIPSKP